jgi:hypothetical protein
MEHPLLTGAQNAKTIFHAQRMNKQKQKIVVNCGPICLLTTQLNGRPEVRCRFPVDVPELLFGVTCLSASGDMARPAAALNRYDVLS